MFGVYIFKNSIELINKFFRVSLISTGEEKAKIEIAKAIEKIHLIIVVTVIRCIFMQNYTIVIGEDKEIDNRQPAFA